MTPPCVEADSVYGPVSLPFPCAMASRAHEGSEGRGAHWEHWGGIKTCAGREARPFLSGDGTKWIEVDHNRELAFTAKQARKRIEDEKILNKVRGLHLCTHTHTLELRLSWCVCPPRSSERNSENTTRRRDRTSGSCART